MKVEKENDKYRLRIERDDCDDSPRGWGNIGTVVMFGRDYKHIGDEHSYCSPDDFLIDLVTDAVNESEKNGGEHTIEWPDDLIARAFDEYVDNICGLYLQLTEDMIVNIRDSMTLQQKVIAGKSLTSDFLIDSISELSTRQLENLVDSLDYYVILPVYLYDHSGITVSTVPFSCPWDSGQAGWIYSTKETFLKETGYTPEQLFEEGKAKELLRSEIKTLDMYLQGYVYYFLLEEKETCEHCNHVEYKHVDSCGGFYANTAEELAKEIASYLPEEAESLLEGLL